MASARRWRSTVALDGGARWWRSTCSKTARDAFLRAAAAHFAGQQETPDGGNRRAFSVLFRGSTISRRDGRPGA